ncbi:glycosyltransferase family 2 protein [Empedobacter sp. ULE_I140]
MNQPLISVIVPCYNQSIYMDECLQSVLNQTYQNWECIIVNDGSPDNTEEVALRWVEKDTRFIYLKKENGGLSSARNAGIEKAKGEWIQFLDCDDKIDHNKFLDASIFFHTNDILISNYQLFEEDKILNDYCVFIDEMISYETILFNWDLKFSIPIHCGLFRCNIISNFNEDLKAKEDWFFWLETLKTSPKIMMINKRQAYYRVHSESMTKDLSHMIQNELKACLRLYEIIDDNLKVNFVKSRLQFKNEQINQFNNIILNLNTELVEKNKKLNSKRYKLIDKVLACIGR